ncbi:MAG: MBL fold metallo-hydrolase [Acidobacteria bacterium]|nr:MBL fold metallo-hydrolase [Acidobacteriota bacterium]
MRNRTTARVLMGVAAVLVMASEAPGQVAAPRRTIEPVSGGVYTATNNNHRTVFLVTPEGIVLADPINADFSKWLKAELAARFKVPVKYVVYSHHHWDHASGGDVFADTARFVGHANMLTHLKLPPPSTTLAQVEGEFGEVARLDTNRNGVVERAEASATVPFDAYDANGDGRLTGAEVMRGPVRFVRPPDVTYKDTYEIRLGGKRVEVSWVGEMNHSLDSSYIAFPDAGVLFLVDFVSFHRLPNREMDYELGRFEQWMTAVRNAEKLAAGFTFVATGHGPVGTVKDITAWRVYFEKLRSQVAAGIARKQTLEQMQRTITMAEYSQWDGFDWAPLNVLGMYHFLTDTP